MINNFTQGNEIFLLALVLQSTVIYFYLRNFFKKIDSIDWSSLFQKHFLYFFDRLNDTQNQTREQFIEKLNYNTLETLARLENALAQNRQELQVGLLNSTQALEKKFSILENQVAAKLESIGNSVESKLNENLKEGFQHFEKVQTHLQQAALKLATLNQIGQSISDLNQLLKLPHLRGGFGEATLERILADFLPTQTYTLQYCISPHSSERVDAIVKLAHQKVLPIECKFPRDRILPLFESQDPSALKQARKALAEFIKAQAKTIATQYIRPEHGTTEMALLFLPSETLYFEIIRNRDLFEYLTKLKIFPVSPNTLALSLQAISLGQEYYEMAQGVEKTLENMTQAKHYFENFEKKFKEVGKGLNKAQEAFHLAHRQLGHYETQLTSVTSQPQSSPLAYLPPQD